MPSRKHFITVDGAVYCVSRTELVRLLDGIVVGQALKPRGHFVGLLTYQQPLETFTSERAFKEAATHRTKRPAIQEQR